MNQSTSIAQSVRDSLPIIANQLKLALIEFGLINGHYPDIAQWENTIKEIYEQIQSRIDDKPGGQ